MADTAKESVTKLVKDVPQKTLIHTVRSRSQDLTKAPGSGVEGLTSAINPIKGDYPEVMLQHLGGAVGAAGPGARGPIPTKKPRPANYRKQANHFGMVSARSKAELRAIIDAAGGEIVHNIQVRDDGKYFVYADKGVGLFAANTEDCVEPTAQKLSDLDLSVDEEDCDPITQQNLEDLPESSKEC